MRLNFSAGKLAGQTVEVTGDRLTIGRAPENDLVLSDEKVSRQHAAIERTAQGEFVLRDLNSGNGTWVDDTRVESPLTLRGGEQIRIGPNIASAEAVERAGAAAGAAGLTTQPIDTEADEPTLVEQPSKASPASTPPPRRGVTTFMRRTEQRMKRLTIVAIGAVGLAVVVAGLAVAGVFSSEDDELDTAAIVDEARASTLLIDMRVGAGASIDDRFSKGSGWVVDAEAGEIVTNAHVASGGQLVKVALPGGQARDAQVGAMNFCQDVALLKTDSTDGLRTLPQVTQDELSDGDPVVALGFPGSLAIGDNLVTTSGVISTVEAKTGKLYPDVVQTDAAINGGNSGGPLLNADGEFVGMNTLSNVGAGSQNQNYAIATDHISSLLGELREGRSQGWLGYVLDYPTDNPGDPEDDVPIVTGQNGDVFYGMGVVGASENAPANSDLVGFAGGREQYVYAIDGVSFSPDKLPASAADTAVCETTMNKGTGDTSTLSIVELFDDQTYETYDVTVEYP